MYCTLSVPIGPKSPPKRAMIRSRLIFSPSVEVSAGARNASDSSSARSQWMSSRPVPSLRSLILRYGVMRKPYSSTRA